MKKSYIPILICSIGLIIISLSTSSCQKDVKQPRTPIEEQNPKISMNTDIFLQIPIDFTTGEKAEYHQGDSVYVYIASRTEKTIQFPPDGNLNIYSFDPPSNSWQELKNRTTYAPIYQVLYPESHEYYRSISMAFKPDVENITESITIRVVIIGDVLENDEPSGEQVGAYIDVQLLPKP